MSIEHFISFTKSSLNISIVGGSNSVIRKGYTKYLKEDIGRLIDKKVSLKYYTLGGITNIHGLIEHSRYDIAANSDIIFYEYGINDRYAIEIEKYSLALSGKSLEGFIRKAKSSNPRCIIVILIFGVNLNAYYQNRCDLSQLYERIGSYYKLPVINLTTILTKERGREFLKSLYHQEDCAHYTRPQGVKIISETIVKDLKNRGIIELLKLKRQQIQSNDYYLPTDRVYADNFEQLAFLDSLNNNYFLGGKAKLSVYRNSVFREKNYTIYPGISFNFLLKGKLIAIFIKSDLSDGFFEISFNDKNFVFSSYSSWVDRIKPQNVISLISLPALKFTEFLEPTQICLSVCQKYPEQFELDIFKTLPLKTDPRQWKLSIIGVAYLGMIMPLKN